MTEAEEHARDLVHGGFSGPEDVVEALTEQFGDELTEDEATRLVDRLWAARVAEQATWPAETEADRVLEVFDELDTAGITARVDFTCCNTCGGSEIGAEKDEHSRGFVFFHQQDTKTAVAGGGLWLSYGTFGDQPAAAIGQEVVTALTAKGVPTEWNGSPDRRIHVTPLTWQLRLE